MQNLHTLLMETEVMEGKMVSTGACVWSSVLRLMLMTTILTSYVNSIAWRRFCGGQGYSSKEHRDEALVRVWQQSILGFGDERDPNLSILYISAEHPRGLLLKTEMTRTGGRRRHKTSDHSLLDSSLSLLLLAPAIAAPKWSHAPNHWSFRQSD